MKWWRKPAQKNSLSQKNFFFFFFGNLAQIDIGFCFLFFLDTEKFHSQICGSLFFFFGFFGPKNSAAISATASASFFLIAVAAAVVHFISFHFIFGFPIEYTHTLFYANEKFVDSDHFFFLFLFGYGVV